MAKVLHDVGEDARTIFTDVRQIGRRVLERFYEGFDLALKDVCPRWRNLKRAGDRKEVFQKVQAIAKELIVSKKDGGGADDGLAFSTFTTYVCIVRRALLYQVPLEIAERATNQELQRARQYVSEELANTPGTLPAKMVKAYEWVEQDIEKRKEDLRQRREAEELDDQSAPGKDARTHSAYGLADPGDYEPDDSVSLLQSGIKSILTWLRAKSLQSHLAKEIPEAKALKHVLGELVAYEESESKPPASATPAAAAAAKA